MKLSLSWIFDHIVCEQSLDSAPSIMQRFNEVSAEIEDYYTVALDRDCFALGKVASFNNEGALLSIPEWKIEVKLSFRDDISDKKNHFFLVIKASDGTIRWAHLRDLNGDKDTLAPCFYVGEKESLGSWKDSIEWRDVVFEVDNKSLTHRPDMWGHRGFAREIAAFMRQEFKEKALFLSDNPAIEGQQSQESFFSFENKAPQKVYRFSGVILPYEYRPSSLTLAFRLARLGIRPINALVDLTNYVMLDWSQPLHAYDCEALDGNVLQGRTAKPGETLELLDGKRVELTAEDCVIATKTKPLALAGIMGGLGSAVTSKTRSLFLEAATFEATSIRLSSLHHKIRTESSARFEKKLPPAQTSEALQRFIKLATAACGYEENNATILSFGDCPKNPVIEVSHCYLEENLGFKLETSAVVSDLLRLEFEVEVFEKNSPVYRISVPSFRATKDITQPIDILEEVVRLYGFKNIRPTLPSSLKEPYDTTERERLSSLKSFLAHGLGMTEQCNYAFYDEQFLARMGYTHRGDEVHIKNPISHDRSCLVTSLLPHLLENLSSNVHDAQELRFFEFSRVWKLQHGSIQEHKELAGLLFTKKEALSFYDGKESVLGLLDCLKLSAQWQKMPEGEGAPWFDPIQSALLVHKDRRLGIAGKINPEIKGRCDLAENWDVFMFVLDGDYLLSFASSALAFSPFSKYQSVSFDLSFFISLERTAAFVENALKEVDPLISSVSLLDFFEKDEWVDVRSLAFRFILTSYTKTLDKEEIDAVRAKAISRLDELGARLRD